VSNAEEQSISRMCLRTASAATLALVLGLGAAVSQPAQGQTFTVLYNFTHPKYGVEPYAGLVRDAKDNFYGTTYSGGGHFLRYGVVYKLDTNGTETVLHNFTGGTDGANPFAELVRDAAGNFYGTTTAGGAFGLGTVFKLGKGGKETVLHSFIGGPNDGCEPYGGLLQGTTGDLYGTTPACGISNGGIVFKVSTTGKETVLHRFTGLDGASPAYTRLLRDKKGDLYGVTGGGGAYNQGVVYKLSTTGKLTVLHSFSGGTTDGCNPYGTPAMDGNGDLYGTTWECGLSNAGIVWKVSKNGNETVLHNFAGGANDGAYPYAGVIMDAKGNLYGDTFAGGGGCEGTYCGTVYTLSKNGTLTLLHRFVGSDGAYPYAGLIWDAKGNLYGTAVTGGSGGGGTVWKLTP